MRHFLKCWIEPFTAMWDGFKRHEFRVEDDRVFCEGDILVQREFEPCKECDAKGTIKHPWGIVGCSKCMGEKGVFTGRELECEVSYVGRAPNFGIPKGCVVMTVKLPGDVFANLQEGDLTS